jgi:aerobic carbon-monoxide dehydrogenase medium subunit
LKAAPFEYSAPVELDEALSLLARYGDEARPLAGGQSLVPLLVLRMARFARLIDLGRVAELVGIEPTDGGLRIGAMTTYADIERDPDAAVVSPLLVEATRHVGHFQIRNRGTIGGSIAHADPTAEYPAVALALDATVEVARESSTRWLPIDGLLQSAWSTSLEPGELVVAIELPAPEPRTGFAIDEIAPRPGDFATAGATAAITLAHDGRVQRARVVLFAVSDRARRITELEDALVGASVADLDLDGLAREFTAGLHPPADVLATSAYRQRMAARLAAAVVRTAVGRAQQQATAARGR